jgi:hypothetical protein
VNAFDPANYPTREPAELIAGDRWVWKRTDLGSDYPPALYALKYALRGEGTDGGEIEITASESGSDYVVEVPAATTATYPAGRYRWQAYIVRSADSERATLASGILTVVPNRDTESEDPRSHARIMLDSIEAALEAFATDTVKSYTITTGNGSRSVTKKDTDELIKLRNQYRGEVADEEARLTAISSPNANARHIGIRFGGR